MYTVETIRSHATAQKRKSYSTNYKIDKVIPLSNTIYLCMKSQSYIFGFD